MLRQVSLLALITLALAACASSSDVAGKDNQVATQTTSVSDADYDKYVDGMIESDGQANEPAVVDVN
jgi:uncharacterized protein YcfL